SFIAEMMPKFPLYACLLSEAARAAMGRVHPDSEPALVMLLEEGLQDQGYIDIFDGGGTIEAPFSHIRSMRDSQTRLLAVGTPGDEAQTYLTHNRGRADCRITAAPGRLAGGTLGGAGGTAGRLR